MEADTEVDFSSINRYYFNLFNIYFAHQNYSPNIIIGKDESMQALPMKAL